MQPSRCSVDAERIPGYGRRSAYWPRRHEEDAIMNRRVFLIGSTATVAGSLVLGYRATRDGFAVQVVPRVRDGESLIAGWVKIASDDTITVYVPHVDVGQGSQTALAMMLADELDADWSKVRVEQAPAEKEFANRFLAEAWVMEGRTVPPPFDTAVHAMFGAAARFLNLQMTGGSTAVRTTGQFGMRTVGAAARAMLVEAAARRWEMDAAHLVAAKSVVRHSR